MRKIRVLLAVAMIASLMASHVWALPGGPEMSITVETLDLPPIRIVNDANNAWSVKVWAYPGWATEWQISSCQTLDYDVAWSRPIDPIKVSDPWVELWTDHCGNYETLTFWFRAWNRETGVYRDFSTFGYPTPWGATWRWDGHDWTCTGC